MKIPTVHNNGTGGKELLEEAMVALRAVNTAIHEVSCMTVHGRDYYVQGGPDHLTVYRDACFEQSERIRLLQTVSTDLEKYCLGIQQQLKRNA